MPTAVPPPTASPRPWVPPAAGPLETLLGAGAGLAAAAGAPVLAGLVRRGLSPLLTRPATGDADRTPTGDGAGGDDEGWFGPESVAWRVHADASMFVAGMAAFALQALDPRAMAGVWDHSRFGTDFFGRTRRTAEFVQGVVYEPSAAAARRCLLLRGVHDRVVGRTPDGRPYSANDPELLEWVHVTEYLAIAAANRRFAAHPMSVAELDRYVAEVARVGAEVGVVDPPRSWADLEAAFRRHRPQLALGEQAATAVRFLEQPPMLALAARPPWRAVWAGAVACLPPAARALLRLDQPPVAEVAACRVVVRALGRFLGEPASLRAARRRLGPDRESVAAAS